MNKINGIIILYIFAFFSITAQVPISDDLKESGATSRRDLSVLGSRLVINPYDFKQNAKVLPSQYNDRPSIPLNVAFLNTKNVLHKEENRYGREYKDILSIYINNDGNIEDAKTFNTEWLPYALPFSAKYSTGSEISGFDTFFNDEIILRSLNLNENQKYIIAGRIKGKISILNDNIILINGKNSNYAISINKTSLKDILLYKSYEDFKAGRSTSNSSDANFWSIEISGKKNLTVGVSFALVNSSTSELVSKVKKCIGVKNVCNITLEKNKKYWDDFIKYKVPHPHNFKLTSVPNKEISADNIRLGYYKAWVLLEQNCLKPEPEFFNYYQMVTGKASLWDEGEAKAPFSASWESFVALQLYSYINPDISWSSLNGIISLINKDGILEGESLPSRKAHSAWVLYSMTNDKKSLEKVYPAIERYLKWRMTQPRWIYFDATPANEKDAEFVVSLMVDMEYMEKIARVLGYNEEAKQWSEKRLAYYKNYLNWFWESPDELPVQFKDNFKHRTGHPVQITQGLILDELCGDYLTGLMGVVYKYYNVNNSFAGFSAPKYPDIDFTIYGLIKKNKPNLVRGLIECNIRDIMRTGPFFAESYTNDPIPLTEGVRPSIFGLASLIDFVLLKNGYMFTKGIPSVVNLFDEVGGVSGINYNGDKIDISIDKNIVKVSKSGKKLKEFEVNRNEMIPIF